MTISISSIARFGPADALPPPFPLDPFTRVARSVAARHAGEPHPRLPETFGEADHLLAWLHEALRDTEGRWPQGTPDFVLNAWFDLSSRAGAWWLQAEMGREMDSELRWQIRTGGVE